MQDQSACRNGVWGETTAQFASVCLLFVISRGRQQRGNKLSCLFYEGTNPIPDGTTFMT